MEMAKAPDTASAGKQQKSFSNIVISIFSSIKKPLTRLTAGERSWNFVSDPTQQQPAVPQPIITAAALIMLIMLLKKFFIFPFSFLVFLLNIPQISHGVKRGKQKNSKFFSLKPHSDAPEREKGGKKVTSTIISEKNPGRQNASRCRIKSNQAIVPNSKKSAKTMNLNGISVFFQQKLCTYQAIFYWKVKLSLPAKTH